jgi:hypothetical protein
MDDTPVEFSVPEKLTLPEELKGNPPRELPESIQVGPLAEVRRKTYWACVLAAAFCFLLSAMPFLETLAN